MQPAVSKKEDHGSFGDYVYETYNSFASLAAEDEAHAIEDEIPPHVL